VSSVVPRGPLATPFDQLVDVEPMFRELGDVDQTIEVLLPNVLEEDLIADIVKHELADLIEVLQHFQEVQLIFLLFDFLLAHHFGLQ
jgi:hypothetical protein